MALKSIIIFILVLLSFNINAQNDLKVYLVGVRYSLEKLTPIDEVQKDQYVLFYQVRSDSLSKITMDKINFALRERYMYNLDFNFFNTSYYSVYHPIICEPRSTNVLMYYNYYGFNFDRIREYDSLKFIAFAEYRQQVISNLGIDSIADAHNDTFYVSKYVEMNTTIPLIERGIIDSAFSLIPENINLKYRLHLRKAIPDSTYITVLRDSILYIHGTEPIILDLKQPRLPFTLFQEVAEEQRPELINKLFCEFFNYNLTNHYGITEGCSFFSIDLYPVLRWYIDEWYTNRNSFSFYFYNSPSPYSSKHQICLGHFVESQLIQKYFRDDSIYWDIFNLVKEIK